MAALWWVRRLMVLRVWAISTAPTNIPMKDNVGNCRMLLQDGGESNMTAEIIVMNKSAIAMAADSAVTINGGDKIFNTVNKLFALSRHQPIGVMICGNAEFMGVPWETLIKMYRAGLRDGNFDTVQEYAHDFFRFVQKQPIFTLEVQQHFVKETIKHCFARMGAEAMKLVEERMDEDGEISDFMAMRIFGRVIQDEYERWQESSLLKDVPMGYRKKFRQAYLQTIEEARTEVFEELPLSKKSKEQLKAIGLMYYVKGRFEEYSGVTFAGFGNSEVFPSVVDCTVESMALGYLKIRVAPQKKRGPSDDLGTITAYAQGRDMAHLFMQGVDPHYLGAINSTFFQLLTQFANAVVGEMNITDPNEKKKKLKAFEDLIPELYKLFNDQMYRYRRQNHSQPILDSVRYLPRDELAALAESLVNLTSLKMRVNYGDDETVGGAIDVAVISKGDGFVWIKRKHYFRAELNPQYFAGYYRE